MYRGVSYSVAAVSLAQQQHQRAEAADQARLHPPVAQHRVAWEEHHQHQKEVPSVVARHRAQGVSIPAVIRMTEKL